MEKEQKKKTTETARVSHTKEFTRISNEFIAYTVASKPSSLEAISLASSYDIELILPPTTSLPLPFGDRRESEETKITLSKRKTGANVNSICEYDCKAMEIMKIIEKIEEKAGAVGGPIGFIGTCAGGAFRGGAVFEAANEGEKARPLRQCLRPARASYPA